MADDLEAAGHVQASLHHSPKTVAMPDGGAGSIDLMPLTTSGATLLLPSSRGASQASSPAGSDAGDLRGAAVGCLGRLRERTVAVFKQNLTAEQLSLSLAIGFTCGLFPVPGLTSVAVLAAASVLSFNMAAAQLVNLLVTALELMLLPVFVFLGETLLRMDDHVSFKPSVFADAVRSDMWGAAQHYGSAVACGILGWSAFVVPGTFLLYKPLVPVVSMIMERMNAKKK